MRKLILICILFPILAGCEESFKAKDNLSEKEYQSILNRLAPYIIEKSDNFSFEDRFKPEHKSFYDQYIEKTDGELKYFIKTDTANLFFFSYKDLSSLYEHYRGTGGYYKTNGSGEITYINLIYWTPRLTARERYNREPLLFNEMATRGNVDKYIGNKNYIQAPNADFYYNPKLQRWDHTENSSWKFLKEAKEKAEQPK